MRYTLRLLTAQQFQRAAALVCAAEVIRRRDEKTWGTTPFRIGLWVGAGVAPNWYDEAETEIAVAKETGKDGRVKVPTRPEPDLPFCGRRHPCVVDSWVKPLAAATFHGGCNDQLQRGETGRRGADWKIAANTRPNCHARRSLIHRFGGRGTALCRGFDPAAGIGNGVRVFSVASDCGHPGQS
jgi:hypothetical protein